MNNDFKNSVILPENLPSVKAVVFNPIDRKYLKLIFIRHMIVGVIFSALGVVFVLLTDKDIPAYFQWIMGCVFLLLFIYSLVISYLSFKFRGYLIREKDIAYQRGLIQYKLTSIPFTRIQHVELNQGVIAKQMGLASIKIYTAGGSSDDLLIPGLPIEIARKTREFLTGRISSDEQN